MFNLGPGGRKYNTCGVFAPEVMFQRKYKYKYKWAQVQYQRHPNVFSTLRYTAVVGKIEIEAFSC